MEAPGRCLRCQQKPEAKDSHHLHVHLIRLVVILDLNEVLEFCLRDQKLSTILLITRRKISLEEPLSLQSRQQEKLEDKFGDQA
eukprot:763658-Hanusia_phi.AAC.5